MLASITDLSSNNKCIPPLYFFVPNAKLPFCFFLKGKEVRKEERASQRPQCRNANSALDDENEQNDWCVCVCVRPSYTQSVAQDLGPPPCGKGGVLWMIP